MSANADKKPKMPIFRDRLDKLRGDMSYSEFAEKLGISRATMGFYLAGNRVPNAVDLKKIAERCEVSADYLLGMSDAAKAENHEIGYALGLSDKSISKLKRFAENKFSKIALNQILESGKIIAYITNYLFSFLEDERKECSVIPQFRSRLCRYEFSKIDRVTPPMEERYNQSTKSADSIDR